jgi:D-amino peptidase
MRVYISIDIEGVAGVVDNPECDLQGVEYERARHWMTGEGRAAIEAAYEAGATKVVIADSHGHMRNLLLEHLPENVEVIRGAPRPIGMMQGIDEGFDAAILLGYHSKEGTAKSTLSHTYAGGLVYDLRVNGQSVGEMPFNAAVAGTCGVPVVLAAGDNRFIQEVEEMLPWAEKVVTKWTYNTYSGRTLTPKESQARIRAGVKQALSRLSEMKLFTFQPPFRLEIELKRLSIANLAEYIPGFERDGHLIAYTSDDFMQVARMKQFITILNRIT